MLELVRHIEELAADAWPAAIVEPLDGWRLRFNWGVTSRANSVWPNEVAGGLPLAEKLRRVEAFYARWDAPARFQVCPAAQPADLDAILAGRGYVVNDVSTCVQTASLHVVLTRTEPAAPYRVPVRDGFEDAWFDAYCRVAAVGSRDATVRGGIYRRIGPRGGFAVLESESQALAVGLGVPEGDWLGIFSMATHAAFRRRGAATAVLRALADWGGQRGAARLYLQVVEENTAAYTLYSRLGFETLYRYHYREACSGRSDPRTPRTERQDLQKISG